MVENRRDTPQARADLRLKKTNKATRPRNKALAEFAAEVEARRVKTERLRALRLAKQAEDDAAGMASAQADRSAATRRK